MNITLPGSDVYSYIPCVTDDTFKFPVKEHQVYSFSASPMVPIYLEDHDSPMINQGITEFKTNLGYTVRP